MMRYIFTFVLITIINFSFAQQQTPLETSGYKQLTTYAQLIDYIKKFPSDKIRWEVEYFARSVKGKDLPVIKFSKGEFGKDDGKLKVLLFAQQHGNEASGKEGALMLLGRIASGELNYLFEKIDLALIPQMNPDGSDANTRRNGNNADLNRDHLILMQPENIGLHTFFNKYKFDVSMDVHEYSPYSQSWFKYGYRKNSDVTLGTLTNCNISPEMRAFSNSEYVPFIKKYITDAGYSFAEYTPGGPPEIEYIRHSTYDINDGRQGFGSLATLSFIQEGINGRDSIHMIERRSKSQMAGMQGYLEFVYKNAVKIKEMVRAEREKIVNGYPAKIAVQMIHVKDGRKLEMPLFSLSTNSDTVVTVVDYRPVVKAVTEVEKPAGYLIPEENKELLAWIKKHNMIYENYTPEKNDAAEQYQIIKIDSTDFEGDIIIDPALERRKLKAPEIRGNFILLPTNQLYGNIIVQALEPKSHIGLATYKPFESLVTAGTAYPVLRLIR